ncbi:MAG: ExbD/TolR family protein [Rubrivivax sp.]
MPGVSSRGRGRRTISEINMVPFIDVMLVLLIIFMVTAPLITTGVVELPSVGQAQQAEPTVIEIVVGKDEKLELRVRGKDGGPLAPVVKGRLAADVQRLQGGRADMPVVITADKGVRYDAVVEVMNVLQGAGVRRVGLSVAAVK